MSISAFQYAQFVKQVLSSQKVFSFTEGNEYLVFQMGDKEVIPFWSSRTRLETIQKTHPKYQKYAIAEMDFKKFYEWLPELAEEKLFIGVNWIGNKLIAYDYDPRQLKQSLDFHAEQMKE